MWRATFLAEKQPKFLAQWLEQSFLSGIECELEVNGSIPALTLISPLE